jgi:cytochrome c oxidase subunit 2
MQSEMPLFPPAASTTASGVDALTIFLVGMSAFFTLLIAAGVIYAAVRYRRRSADEVGDAFHANMMLEITWTAIPLVIVLFCFFWGAEVFFVNSHPPKNSLPLTATGKQWMWRFQHPDGQREINTLHVPKGQPVKIEMISEDVIHSLYMPAFRVKMDVVPGRYTTLWFNATRTGSFHIFCAEYCGTKHSGMIGAVIVMEPADYQQWLAGGAAAAKPPEQAGAELFVSLGCSTCHVEAGGGRAPSLRGVYGSQVHLASGETVTADATYVRRSILEPPAQVVAGYQPIMPTFKGQVSEENLFRLIAYIKSLGAGQQNAPAAAGAPATGVATTSAPAPSSAAKPATAPNAPPSGGTTR